MISMAMSNKTKGKKREGERGGNKRREGKGWEERRKNEHIRSIFCVWAETTV